MIIFDLDQTLVDTSSVENLRKSKKWSQVMASVPSLNAFEGINQFITELDNLGQKIAIVTHSPSMVAEAFAKKYKWPISIILGYHQAPRKPNPTSLRLAMQAAGAKPNQSFHIGDRPEDTQASRAAGVYAIGAAWGIHDSADLAASNPDYMANSVSDLRQHLIPLL